MVPASCAAPHIRNAVLLEVAEVAGSDAIADVGETLVSLLRAEVSSGVTVALASPADFDPSQAGLSLFLYDVERNIHLSNEPQPVEDDVAAGDPLALELSYLVTAHPSPQDEAHEQAPSRLDYHKELGEAMRIIWDNRIISGSALKGDLGGDDRLHIALENRSMGEILDVWNTFQETPYLPSVTCAVTPVLIESERETPIERVTEATFSHGRSDR